MPRKDLHRCKCRDSACVSTPLSRYHLYLPLSVYFFMSMCILLSKHIYIYIYRCTHEWTNESRAYRCVDTYTFGCLCLCLIVSGSLFSLAGCLIASSLGVFVKGSSKFSNGRRLLTELFPGLGDWTTRIIAEVSLSGPGILRARVIERLEWFYLSGIMVHIILDLGWFSCALHICVCALLPRLFATHLLELFVEWVSLWHSGYGLLLGRMQTPADLSHAHFCPVLCGDQFPWRHCERDMWNVCIFAAMLHEYTQAYWGEPFRYHAFLAVWNCRMGACWRLESGAEAGVTCKHEILDKCLILFIRSLSTIWRRRQRLYMMHVCT